MLTKKFNKKNLKNKAFIQISTWTLHEVYKLLIYQWTFKEMFVTLYNHEIKNGENTKTKLQLKTMETNI